jgi:hypothetical protein
MKPTSKERFVLIHFLPFVHLCTCLLITVEGSELGWQYLMVVDFPVSVVAVAMMFRDNNHQIWFHPLLWFGTLGTLWWYFLSKLTEHLFDRLKPESIETAPPGK